MRTLLFFIVFLAGCASVPEDAQFQVVADDVHQRSGIKPFWRLGDASAVNLDQLLTRPLTEDSAIKLALLNNPSLQARYAELGVAQADLVQAGLLTNPSLGGLFKFPVDTGGSADLTFSLTYNFLNAILLPLRQSVAESAFEETRLDMVKATIDLVGQVRSDYFKAVGSGQLKLISDELLLVADASYETTKALHKAGNVTDYDLATAEAVFEQAKVDNDRAASHLLEASSRLALTLGVGVDKVRSCLESKLTMPTQQISVDVPQVLAVSLDVAMAQQRLQTLGRQYQVTNITALIPELHIGGETERKDGAWEVGPAIEFALPIFDQGQVAVARARFEIQGAQENFKQTSLQVKTTASMLNSKAQTLWRQISKMQKKVLPLTDEAVQQTLLLVNAMTKSVTDLLMVKQNQIEAQKTLAELTLDYWLTRVELEQLRFGSLPSGGSHK